VCVNELQREARQKLFSYAVAALSNFFWDSLRISRELSIMGRRASPIGPLLCVGERVRTHSDTGRSHKVIGIGSSRQWSRNGPKYYVARDCHACSRARQHPRERRNGHSPVCRAPVGGVPGLTVQERTCDAHPFARAPAIWIPGLTTQERTCDAHPLQGRRWPESRA